MKSVAPGVKKSRTLTVDAVGVAVLLAATGAAYALGIEPIRREHHQAAENHRILIERRDELATLEGELRQMRILLATLEESSRETVALDPPSAVNRRLARVADLAAEAGVQLDRVDPRPVVREKRYGRISIHLTGSGGYAAVTRLIRGLHAGCPDTALRSLEVSGSVGATDVDPRFTAELVWFTSLDEKPATSGGASAG